MRAHSINCDGDAFVPPGWMVERHKRDGQREWGNNTKLHFDESQNSELTYVTGHEIRKKLADQPTLNANVLDFLLENPVLIPEEWKNKAIYFWGTVYRHANEGLCVRCLCWHGLGWGSYGTYLWDKWNRHRPAVLWK